MTLRGGDIRDIKWWGKTLDPAQDMALTLFLSGLTLENLPNGNGTMHSNGKRQLGGFDGGVFSCDPTRSDLEFFQGKQTAGVPGPLIITLVNNAVYVGSCQVEGQIAMDTGAGTMTLAARGTLAKA